MLTADEFLAHPAARGPSELVRGEIRMMTPASGRHGVVTAIVFGLLWSHVRPRRLGQCFADNTGFQLHIPGERGDTVRAPDVAFVRVERMPRDGVTSGWMQGAPDLAVEVLSPSESIATAAAKRADYFAAGTTLVWVIDPEARTLEIHTTGAPVRRLHVGDRLDGAPILPDFGCDVAELFEGLAP